MDALRMKKIYTWVMENHKQLKCLSKCFWLGFYLFLKIELLAVAHAERGGVKHEEL